MQKDNVFLDDIAKLASGAAGSLLDIKREIEQMVGAQMEKLLQKSNFATREEYDTVIEAMSKLQKDIEKLSKRLDNIEKKKK